jgi:uncharacterized coiled-coil DUF342 family protein
MQTMPRETWTDERLDDLKDGMHREFGQVHAEIGQVRAEIGGVRGEIGGVRGEINELRAEMNRRFDSLNRTLILAAVSLAAAILAKGGI